MRWRLLALALVLGCPAPGIYSVDLPGETCLRATRLAFRSMAELGYRVTGVVEPTVVKPGRIEGVKRDPGGREARASVRISCDVRGARLQPVEGALVPSSYDFSRAFGYSVKSLAKLPDVEAPMDGQGLEVLLEALDEPRARLDLGGPVLAGEGVLVRVTVRNHTDRTVVLDRERVTLATAGGNVVRALEGGALEGRLGAGAAADTVRGGMLRRRRVAGGETVQRYLVFPGGAYVDGQVAIEDVETGESDGFVVPLQ